MVILFTLLISAFLGYQIGNLQVNSDVLDSLPDDDPDAVLLKEIGEKYGGNRIGIVILETDNIYQTSVLEDVKVLTDSLSNMENIRTVTSLTNIIEIKGGDFGIEVGTLVDEYDLPEEEEDLLDLKRRVNAKDLYKANLVSEDGTSTAIIFGLYEDADIHEVADNVRSLAAKMDLNENVYFSGSPMLVSAISDLISKDMARLIPITFVVIAIVLLLGFKTLTGVILPLVVAALGILWTVGLMALGGYEMSMISSNLPILLLAVGSAYSIHVVNRIRVELDKGDRNTAITLAMGYIFIPVMLSAVTTAVGFSSFTFGAYLEMIRDYGLFTALGTLFSCILSLTLVPAVLSFIPVKPSPLPDGSSKLSFVRARILSPLFDLIYKYPKTVLMLWIILMVAGIGGIFIIKRQVDVKDYFKKNNSTRRAEEIMTEKFGGTKPVFVQFKGDMQNPEVLHTMVRTADYMEESPDILATQSIADLIMDLSEALGEGKKIPESQAMVEQLWFLIDGNEYLERFITEDLDEGIIISKFISPDNQSKKAFADYMQAFIDQNSREDCQISITGMPFVDVTMDRSLVNSQIGSLSIAVVFVIIIVGIILGSLRSGLQAAVPILATIMILFGVMGYTGIPLNIATVLVASVALGIGIDYSVHIITHYNKSVKIGASSEVAIKDAIVVSGKAIVINVASVSAGFSILLLSEMVPLQYFGLLVAISMIGSGLGALTLLPLILVLSRKKT